MTKAIPASTRTIRVPFLCIDARWNRNAKLKMQSSKPQLKIQNEI